MAIINIQKINYIMVTTDDEEYTYMRRLDYGGENDWEILRGEEWVESVSAWPDLEQAIKDWNL
jgi:hypothetical protein